MRDQKAKGTIIAYLTVILQIIVQVFFTPLLIQAMGLDEYGLYETINSFGATLLIMNFGVAAIVSRNIVKFKKENNKEKLENFLAMSAIISAIICGLIIVVGMILSGNIETLYNNSLNPEQLNKAGWMFIYIVANLGIMTWRNYTSGIIVGYEKFIFGSTTKLLKQILRISLLSVLLMIGINALTIVIVDLVVTLIIITVELIYCFFKIKVPIKFHKFDKPMMKEVFLFSIASLIQTITNQINLSLDKVILGIMCTTSEVAVYSIGMLIVSVMVSILQIISGVYLPAATRLVLEKADGERFTDLIIKPGRVQSFIGCGIVFGFILIGKEFLCVWVGEKFEAVWLSTVILLIFTMLSYVSSVANVILDAMLKKMARSLILIGTAILNVIITIFLIKVMGYLGAAIGTAISMLIGNLILLNTYYKKKIKINIFRMYKEIFYGILPSAILGLLVAMPLKLLIHGNWARVIVLGIVFVLCYVFTLMKWGLKEDEQKIVNSFVTKFKNRLKMKNAKQ